MIINTVKRALELESRILTRITCAIDIFFKRYTNMNIAEVFFIMFVNFFMIIIIIEVITELIDAIRKLKNK
ncbi:hypothetical protein [Peptacetobacter sp. AB845]|uniref:hypothetical protein n=1 Tax=Peptacetobacter sp. AB845 TaxID=3388429 RepID=UPI0039C9C05C